MMPSLLTVFSVAMHPIHGYQAPTALQLNPPSIYIFKLSLEIMDKFIWQGAPSF